MKPPPRRTITNFVRIAISLGLIAFLLTKVDLPTLLAVWRDVALPLLGLALLLHLGGMVINSWKWWLLLRAAGERVSFGWTIRASFIGQFFNNFLPTMIGGDAVRVYLLRQRIERTSTAIASVVVGRITGFLALTIIAAVALTLSAHVLAPVPGLLAGVIGCVVVAGTAVACTLAAPVGARWLLHVPVPNTFNWRAKLQSVAGAMGGYYRHRRTMAWVILLSFVYQLLLILVNYAAIRALKIDIPFNYAALMVPISDIIGLVPIFVNSLGAREGTFVVLLKQLGQPATFAIALSFLIFLIRLVASLLGGVFYLLDGLHGQRRRLGDDVQAMRAKPLTNDV
jgi:glycosyltransferase 2 family protein